MIILLLWLVICGEREWLAMENIDLRMRMHLVTCVDGDGWDAFEELRVALMVPCLKLLYHGFALQPGGHIQHQQITNLSLRHHRQIRLVMV